MRSMDTVPREAIALGVALEELGWPTEVFWSAEAAPGLQAMHRNPDLPDDVWLKAMDIAGLPHACLGCFQSGDGLDCLAGRCRHASPLILPPSATWKGGFR